MTAKTIKNAEVALKSIVANQHNPRKTFDKESLSELTASIKQHGVLQPVVVRFKGKQYELVAGERRLKAARAAGLSTLPARIVEMTDKEVLEAAIVENEQRDGVNDFEKADGYAQLIYEHKVKIEDVAGRVGKSVSTIRALLRLRNVPKAGRKAHAEGILSTAVCGLIAARPNALMRQRVLQQALTKCDHWGSPATDGHYPTYRKLKDWIEQNCMVELKQAPFDQKDATLWETAGSCEKCPKRTGNDREQFPEGRADVCTDPACFEEKKKLHRKNALAKAKAKGLQVLSDEEAKKCFPFGDNLCSSNYYDLAETCYRDPKKAKRPRSYKQLLGKQVQNDQLFACLDPEGSLHTLIERKVANPILTKEHGVKFIASSSNASQQEIASQKKQKEAEKKRAEERRKLVDEAMSRLLQRTNTVNVPKQTEDVLRSSVITLFNQLWVEGKREIYRSRGIKGGNLTEKLQCIQALLDDANCHELVGWLGELHAVHLSITFGSKTTNLNTLFDSKEESK